MGRLRRKEKREVEGVRGFIKGGLVEDGPR